MAAVGWPPRPFYSNGGDASSPQKESQASVRWPGNRLCALRRGGKATASPGREVKASRIAGCPEPGETIPCRSGTSWCHTPGKRPAWPVGRSSGSPVVGSASPAWCDTLDNRPAYPTPLLGNLEPAVLMVKHTDFQGGVKGMTPRMRLEYEHWPRLYARTCRYEYFLRPPLPRPAIVAEDPHERAVFPVSAATLPIFRSLQALERRRIARQGAAGPDVFLRLH